MTDHSDYTVSIHYDRRLYREDIAGSKAHAAMLAKQGIMLDTMRIRSFPFHEEVARFIDEHELVYVIEQNRDAQLKSLLKIECNATDEKMHSILSYNGVVTSANCIESAILADLSEMSKLASA